MEKRTRTLCLLVGAVVLLLVAYFGIRGFNKNQEKKAEKEAKVRFLGLPGGNLRKYIDN